MTVSDTLKKIVAPWTQMSHFGLWVATRLADPTFKNVRFGDYAYLDPEWVAVATPMYSANLMMDLSGQFGVSMSFLAWSGYQYLPHHGVFYEQGLSGAIMHTNTKDGKVDPEFEGLQMHSMMLYSKAFPGTCTGGYTPLNKEFEKDAPYYKAVCAAVEQSSPELAMEMCGMGVDTGLLKPTAFASFLIKGMDIVLAIQGTQMHKIEMYEYSMLTSPIMFEYKNAGIGGYYGPYTTAAVVTEGLAKYVYQLLFCMDYLTSKLGKELGYITGHSLGGSAATLYAQLLMPNGLMGVSTFLVSFGAPATMNRDCLYGTCPSMKYNWAAGNDFNKQLAMGQADAKMGCGMLQDSVTAGQVAFIPGSLRIMHKFDPVPSMGYGFGNWAHATQYGLLLFDMPGCKMPSVPECSFGTIPERQAEGIASHVCSKGVTASGKLFMCAPEYYTYTHLANPFPCVEVMG